MGIWTLSPFKTLLPSQFDHRVRAMLFSTPVASCILPPNTGTHRVICFINSITSAYSILSDDQLKFTAHDPHPLSLNPILLPYSMCVIHPLTRFIDPTALSDDLLMGALESVLTTPNHSPSTLHLMTNTLRHMSMPVCGAHLTPRPLPCQAEAKKGPGPRTPIWGVLSGHHTHRCVRVVVSIGNSNVPSCPFLGPTHSIWVPSVTADSRE